MKEKKEITKNKSKVQEAKDFGIDVSLLYENLKLTPAQRIRKHEEFCARDRLTRAANSSRVVGGETRPR